MVILISFLSITVYIITLLYAFVNRLIEEIILVIIIKTAVITINQPKYSR